jgi:hypothetical protein
MLTMLMLLDIVVFLTRASSNLSGKGRRARIGCLGVAVRTTAGSRVIGHHDAALPADVSPMM